MTELSSDNLFFVAGMSKCGSTSLWHELKKHPQIFLSEEKELNWFTVGENNQDKIEEYKSKFVVGEHKIYGDVSPEYILHDHALRKISSTFGSAKVVVILRDPVQRAISNIKHAAKIKGLALGVASYRAELFEDFKDRLARGHNPSYFHSSFGYLWKGEYVRHIDRLFRYFDEEQVKIIRIDDLSLNTSNTWSDLTEFLGVSNEYRPGEFAKINVTQTGVIPEAEVTDFLSDYYAPYNRLLSETYGVDTTNWT